MNETPLWSAHKTVKVIGRMRATLKMLEDHGPTIAHRARTPGPAADGYGTGIGDGVGVAGGGVSDPTAGAASALADGYGTDDPIAELWATASESMRAALAALDAASRATSRAMDLGEAERGRRPASDACRVCAVDAASRRGMCDADYQAWRRAGQPELVAWVDDAKADRLRWPGIDPARLEGEAARPGRKAASRSSG